MQPRQPTQGKEAGEAPPERELFRAIAEQTADLIALTDAHGAITYASSACLSLFRCAPEEMCGRPFTEFLDESAIPAALAAFGRGRDRDERVGNLELTMKRKDGSTFSGEVNGSRLPVGGQKGSLLVIRDITERKRVEQALQESQKRFQGLAEAASDFVWEMDTNGAYTYCSSQMLELWGYKPEDMIGKSPFDFMLPEDRERALEMFGGRSGSPRPFRGIETSSRDSNGRLVLLETSGVPFFDNNGRLCGYRGVSRDITERKRAEEALAQSEDRYRRIVEQSLLGIGVSKGNEIIFANDALLRIFGYEDLEEITKVPLLDLVAPSSRELVADRMRMVAEGRPAPPEFEYDIVRKDGQTRTLRCSATHFLQGGEVHTQSTFQDVTEREQMEESLLRTQFVVDHSQELVHWVDWEGRILYVNDACCRRLGYSREELLGMTVNDIDPLMPRPWRSRYQEVGEGGASIFESVHRTKDGEEYPVEIMVNYLNYRGQRYSCSTAHDITERKRSETALRQSEEQLRQSQKMEAVGQLAGGIAHDFNNLLTAILGYSDLMLASGSSTVDEVRSDLEQIKQAAERASALTRQVLAFSRRQAMRPRVVTLDEVIRGIEPLLRRTIGEDIDLVILDSPPPAPVEVDPHQFEQVLMNLVLNARDAMPSGGKLTIEIANVELDEQCCRTRPGIGPGSYVMLSVSDSGVGMDEATKERMFEPFFSTKALGTGTGLGLATVYGIVKQSQGFIFVESEPGNGTSLEIYLPRSVRREAPEQTQVPRSSPASGTETILVVEDEAALRSLIERILGEAGYTTLCRGSAQEALEALERGECSVDMLLTDVVLPGSLQGHDLARTVLAARPGLPVLFISGYARDALVHAGRLDKGVNLLEKPFTAEALVETVREVLDQPRGSR